MGELSSITHGLVENHTAALSDVGDTLLEKMQSAQDKEKWGKKNYCRAWNCIRVRGVSSWAFRKGA